MDSCKWNVTDFNQESKLKPSPQKLKRFEIIQKLTWIRPIWWQILINII